MPKFRHRGALFLVLLILDLTIPAILLARKASEATPEEVEAKKQELKKQIQERDENKVERELENDQHSWEGDTDHPNEENTGQDVEH
jgi:predicted Holliday junction resolvase-like endonuclease